MTPARLKLLRFLRDQGPQRGREIAKAMWPDSPKWRVHYNCGPKGSHVGGAMYQAGGAFAGRVARATGWVSYRGYERGWAITDEGYAALNAHEPREEAKP
ncbi:MAG: hypothetical protein AAFQ53_11315 [Bacteroidota bacterium]